MAATGSAVQLRFQVAPSSVAVCALTFPNKRVVWMPCRYQPAAGRVHNKPCSDRAAERNSTSTSFFSLAAPGDLAGPQQPNRSALFLILLEGRTEEKELTAIRFKFIPVPSPTPRTWGGGETTLAAMWALENSAGDILD
ncbi:hypothetical protein RRG08_003723 [Elysia crispata]|uniref:Uncharacterized protein n=1 Tax=Elysia crispata TaxID=231223 RepID=A0AAE1AV26_9GAST|nr:hypothetical protein RRG08_003723 [Elysia crispata]